jgi:hypothetical protein
MLPGTSWPLAHVVENHTTIRGMRNPIGHQHFVRAAPAGGRQRNDDN